MIGLHHFHTETHNQLEFALSPESPLDAIDSLVLAQETIRTVFIKHNIKATMTPKPLLSGPTNGIHLHWIEVVSVSSPQAVGVWPLFDAERSEAKEEKSALYRNLQYELVLNTKGTFMKESKEDISDASKLLCQKLLDSEQDVPEESVFDDAVFWNACQNLQGKNEARVIQDISQLIVPSAETLALRVESLE